MITLENPSHPGEVLAELFLVPRGMSPIALSKKLGVPRTRIERLVAGKTSMTADTALRLSTFLGNTAEFWLNLQRAFDLAEARREVDEARSDRPGLPSKG